MATYHVEVLRTIACAVEVEASEPWEAAEKVNRTDFPLPPVGEWNPLDGWEYVVYDDMGTELYRDES